MSIRLLHASTLRPQTFTGADVPPYAILSHTWLSASEEITLSDLSRLHDASETATATAAIRAKGGYQKLLQTCTLALQHGLAYVWLDTCTIDKTSSAELSEAINSMFAWYRSSAVCFAYLSDLAPGADLEEALWACRWFTRGWCLQELIAPRRLQFYDRAWTCVGTRAELSGLVAQVSKVDEAVLRDSQAMHELPVARRMSWASERVTTRLEDTAYCLLGIFDVNMPLLYGEGNRAFLRLQEEIITRTNDLSIFFCSSTADQPHRQHRLTSKRFRRPPRQDNSDSETDGETTAIASFDATLPYRDLFATSPLAFIYGGHVVHAADADNAIRHVHFSQTNNGIHFPDAELKLQRLGTVRRRYTMSLQCFKTPASNSECEIVLRKVGPARFVRLRHCYLRHKATHKGTTSFSSSSMQKKDTYTYREEAFIATALSQATPTKLNMSHDYAIRIRSYGNYMQNALQEPTPRAHWDESKQEFLTLGRTSFEAYIQVFPHLIEDVKWIDRKDEGYFYLAVGLASATKPAPSPFSILQKLPPQAWVRMFSVSEWKRHQRRIGSMVGLRRLKEGPTGNERRAMLDLGTASVVAEISEVKGRGTAHRPHFIVHLKVMGAGYGVQRVQTF